MSSASPPAASTPSSPPRKSSRASRAYRARFALVLVAIAAFRAVGPLSYFVLAFWASTNYFARLQHLRLSPTPLSVFFQASILVWALSEVSFSIVYQFWAIRASRRRPPTTYDPTFLRDVVKKVLESDMHSSEEAIEDGDASLSKAPCRRRRATSASSDGLTDSGYASSSSSFSGRASLPLKYNFLAERLSFDDARARDFRECARSWFHGAPFEEVRREDASQWMSWSLYGQPYEEVVNERRNSIASGARIERMTRSEDVGRDKLETVDTSVDLWEARAGVKLPEGKNPEVGVVRLTLDKMRVMSRPFGLYLAIWAAQRWYRGKCARMGFVEQEHEGLRFWIRIPTGWEPSQSEDRSPILFLHGLGLGPVQYSPILNRLAHDPAFQHRPLVFLLQPHLSMSIFASGYMSPPSAATVCASVLAMAKACRFDTEGLTVLSHSNGTIVHGWLLKGAPHLVRRSLIVDPVCFALWEPALPYNFLYASAKSPMSHLMRYFVSRELGVANVLQRHFDWISSNLWPTDVADATDPSRFSVHLSAKDTIVDTPRISRYLAREGLKDGEGLKVFSQKHGDSMLGHGSGFEAVLDWVRNDSA